MEVRDELAENIRDRVSEMEDGVKHGLISLSYIGKTKLDAIREGITQRVSLMKEQIVSVKVGLVENVRMVGLEATDSIRDTIDRSLCKVKDSSIATKEAITETFEKLDEASSDAKAKTQELIENLTSVIQRKSDDCSEKAMDIHEDIQNNIAISREKTVDRLTDISDTVEENVSTLKRNFRDFSLHDQFCDAVDEFSDSICTCRSRISESMYSIASGIEDEVYAGVLQASEVLAEGIDTISSEINEVSYSLRER